MIEFNPSLDGLSPGSIAVIILLLLVTLVFASRRGIMKDINITLFIEHEVDDQELQAKLLEFLESIDGVEQVDITIDNVDETA